MSDTNIANEMLDSIAADVINGNQHKRIGDKQTTKYDLDKRYEIAKKIAADQSGPFTKARFRSTHE